MGGSTPSLAIPSPTDMQEPDPFDMLLRAKWNIPRAAAEMGMPPCEASWEELKVRFRKWFLDGLPQRGDVTF